MTAWTTSTPAQSATIFVITRCPAMRWWIGMPAGQIRRVAAKFTVIALEKKVTLRDTRRVECDTCSEFGCGKFHYVQVAWYGSACISAITVTTIDKQLALDEYINESDFPNDTLWLNTTSMSALRELLN